MSLYQTRLKHEIEFYQEIILRNYNNIENLKKELEENIYVISRKAYLNRIKNLSNNNIRLNKKLEKLKRQIY